MPRPQVRSQNANHHADVAIVGAGAAGLMCAVTAAELAPAGAIVLLDSAKTPGAKINISGGGRCNVTHDVADTSDFCGSTPAAIAKVLRRFSVADTVSFFTRLGVPLKREPSGKLFPVSDRAKDVSSALLRHVRALGITLAPGNRVASIAKDEDGFRISCPESTVRARRVVLATGGQSLPKTGSDGHGFVLARELGHSTTARITPSLVPLLLSEGDALTKLSGMACDVALTLVSARGRRLHRAGGALLCTHFGVSGPVVLDMSRHYEAAQADDPGAALRVSWLPGQSRQEADQALRTIDSGTVLAWLEQHVPKRLAAHLTEHAGVPSTRLASELTKDRRHALAQALTEYELSVTGNRGWRYAEATAGGVPLAEVNLATMESRRCPGLHLCGEILDVDGRIGGFNFQWAWASGFVAGSALAAG